MPVSICIVTHNQVGAELLKTVSSMVDTSVINIQAISIPSDITPDQLGGYADKVNEAVKNCNTDESKLILCDLYGATPYNLIKYFSEHDNVKVVTGLNLAMLLKTVQITHEPLDVMIQKVVRSAQKSIVIE